MSSVFDKIFLRKYVSSPKPYCNELGIFFLGNWSFDWRVFIV